MQTDVGAPVPVDVSVLRRVPKFTVAELYVATTQMAKNKCADSVGVVAEMLQYASPLLLERFVLECNTMVETGTPQRNWLHTVFQMLPKSGPLHDVGNWRPIAVLRTLHKATSRMIYNRLLPVLDKAQSPDQCGFRPNFCIEEALFTIEMLLSRTGEFNMPLWTASIDLKKAFDRVEHGPLLEALAAQGVDPELKEFIRTFC